MTEIADADKYFFSRYGIGFDTRQTFLLSDGSGFGKNVIIFGVNNSSSVQTDNKEKYLNSW